MTEKTIVHAFEDMPDLRSMHLADWGWPKNWGVCMVGHALESQGVPNYSHCVKFSEVDASDNITEHYYPIPNNVNFLIGSAKRDQSIKERDKIRSALGF